MLGFRLSATVWPLFIQINVAITAEREVLTLKSSLSVGKKGSHHLVDVLLAIQLSKQRRKRGNVLFSFSNSHYVSYTQGLMLTM